MANARIVALGVAMAALVGVVAASTGRGHAALAGVLGLVGVSQTPANTPVADGPYYLVGNQPWYYGRASSAVMPSSTQQTNGASPMPLFSTPSDCGCY